MSKPIHEASYNDLMRFAAESGLDVQHGKTKLPEVRAKVAAAFGDDFLVPGADASAGEPEQVVVTPAVEGTTLSADYRHDPKVVVNVAPDTLAGSMNGGSRPLPVCVNGDQVLIKRDTDVAIPYRHYLALKNAKETVMRQEVQDNGQRVTIESDQYAVRFNVVEMPSKAEIEAFHARTKDLGREPVKQKQAA